MRVRPAPVGQCLAVVIVLLFAIAQRGEGDVAIGNGRDVVDVATGDGGEAEVPGNDR